MGGLERKRQQWVEADSESRRDKSDGIRAELSTARLPQASFVRSVSPIPQAPSVAASSGLG